MMQPVAENDVRHGAALPLDLQRNTEWRAQELDGDVARVILETSAAGLRTVMLERGKWRQRLRAAPFRQDLCRQMQCERQRAAAVADDGQQGRGTLALLQPGEHALAFLTLPPETDAAASHKEGAEDDAAISAAALAACADALEQPAARLRTHFVTFGPLKHLTIVGFDTMFGADSEHGAETDGGTLPVNTHVSLQLQRRTFGPVAIWLPPLLPPMSS